MAVASLATAGYRERSQKLYRQPDPRECEEDVEGLVFLSRRACVPTAQERSKQQRHAHLAPTKMP